MERIKGLDGVRGFASVGVVAFHVAVLGGYTGQYAMFDRTIGRGDCFVRLFFMLSSFSLMCAYYEQYDEGNFDIEKYVKKRILRIFPVFWVVMIMTILVNAYQGGTNNVWEIIGTSSMFFALMPSGQDAIVWGGWSMGIQLIFYLLFPVFLVMTRNRKRAYMSFFLSILLLLAYTNYYGTTTYNSHINISSIQCCKSL